MSMAPDYVVEVRDVNLVKRGQIAPERLDLKFTEVFRGIGAWQLKLPAEHPMLAYLKVKGSGIIVTDRVAGRTYSGRTHSALLSQDAEDPKGTWVIDGYDDNVVAAATCIYPDPANVASAQAAAYWVATADGETLMKSVIQANIGSAAIASRKYPWLTVAANANRGLLANVSLRFDNLADVLTDIGLRTNLGWRFAQVGAAIQFDVYVPADKTATVRLDVRNGGLEATELGWTAPSATEVLVLGQGEGADRTVLPISTSTSLAEAAAWGLRWEVAKDQRNTDDPIELQQAGEAELAERGATINQIKVSPSDAPNMRVGKDWWLGDRVTVMIDGTPTQAILTEVATSITSEGVIKQVTIGDPTGFDWEAKVGEQLDDHERRVSDLETFVAAGFPERIASDARLLDTEDLDTINWSGWAVQPYSANATSARNYPTTRAGTLFSIATPGVANSFRFQEYVDYQTRAVYVRTAYTGVWTPWRQMLPEDSGWITLPLATGYAAWSANEVPAYRKVGNQVFFKGLIKPSAGGNLPTAEYIPVAAGAIPVEYRFDATKYGQNALYSAQGAGAASAGALRVQSNGGIMVRPTTSATAYVGLYNVSYFTD